MKRKTWLSCLLLPLLATACAGDLARDPGLSPCAAQYRAFEQRPPAPPGLSAAERAEYERSQRDYHVSQACQQQEPRDSVSIPLHPGR